MNYDKYRDEAYGKVLKLMTNIYMSAGYEAHKEIDSIKYRIKSESSIINKMKLNKVGKDIFDVYDLVGIRYIFKDLNDCKKLKEAIESNKDINIFEVRDYMNGHPEDPNYKALHFRVVFEGYPCEIEFIDIEMEKHIALTHEDYKKGLLIEN